MVKRVILALLVAILPAIGQNAPAPATGSVKGIVLDAEGVPISGANVYGMPEADMRQHIGTVANDRGEFTLQDLPPGGVYLHAYKAADGYPDSLFAFYRTGRREVVKVDVKSGETVLNTVIELGLRVATLRITILDENGKPYDGATLVFTRPGSRGPYRRSVTHTESVLVPAAPFRLMVEAKGYRIWHYGGDAWEGPDGILTLKSGDLANVVVQLMP